jgi:acyl-CoA synthetase (NDP forming)
MPPAEGKDFDRVFHPRGVAVVGASSNPSKFGFIFYYGLKNSGAPVYPVNPNEREVLGDKCYPTVDAIPHQVDYAVISIPAPSVPKVIEDCGRKGVKAVSIYTAGYGEEGTEEGRRRERELAETARRSGVRVIGPNCIGIYCPRGRLSFFAGLPLLEGEVGFLSQSGGHAEELAYKAENWGVRFSKIVSFGNACDVTPEELLEYLGEDPDTRIIGMYIEGSRNGRRFFEVLRRVAARKPVVVWKGGETEAGARAVASHTGSLAGSAQVWRAALRQAGALQVEDFEEMVDVLSALRYLHLPRGRRVAVVGAGGGAGVASTDACERNGLKVAPLREETMERLGRVVPPLGTSVRNPVDLSYFALFNFSLMEECVEILASDPGVDAIIAHVSHLDMMMKALPTPEEEVLRVLARVKERMEAFPDKPLALVLAVESDFEVQKRKVEMRERLVRSGMCVFPTTARAARALSHLATLRELRERRARAGASPGS